ncbi:MAG: PIN domain-containing protein [Nanoarchaeota archaeon]|nr:PIN domain-containing protein [Nanoarchaeota archaeon]
MQKRYYLDTSIWRDFYENRKDRFRPLGEWAFELFKKIIREKSAVLYSEATFKELRDYFSIDEIKRIFSIVAGKGLLEKVEISQEQKRGAGNLCNIRNIPFNDCLHAVLARDNSAIMVARDHHFELLADITESKKPEELL